MTEEQLNIITKGQILYRFPNGVSDSPISSGTMYIVTEKYEDGDLKIQALPEYLGDTYHSNSIRIKKDRLLPIKTPSGYVFEIYHVITPEIALAGLVRYAKEENE